MPQYGYDQGNPFGDPNKFTRSTQESEVNAFNSWMRSQPWWQNIKAQGGNGDISDQQQKAIVQAAQANGISVPKDFHIDEAGNFNQKSRVKRNLIIGAAIGGAALTGGLALSGAFAGSGGAAIGGAAGTTGAGGTLGATTIGTGFLPAIAGGTGISSAGLGAGAGAAASAAGAGSKFAGLGKSLLNKGGLEAGSRMLGAFSENEAQNRGVGLEAALAGDQARLAATQDKRTGEADAMRKLAQTDYLINWKDPKLSSSNPNLPTYGFGPTAPSAERVQAARELQAQLQKRIAEGGDFHPSDYTDLAKPKKGERLSGLLSAGLGFGSLLYR